MGYGTYRTGTSQGNESKVTRSARKGGNDLSDAEKEAARKLQAKMVADRNAKTTPLAPANITKSPLLDNNVDRDPRGAGLSAWAMNANKAWNDSIAKAATKSSSTSLTTGPNTGPAARYTAPVKAPVKINTAKPDNSNRSILFDPTSRNKFLNGGEAKTAVDSKFSISTSTDPNNGMNLSYDNDTVAAKDKYNQAYWASELESGIKTATAKNIADGMSAADAAKAATASTQSSLNSQQKAVGSKDYSGAEVVSEGNMRTAKDTLNRVTGSMDTVGNGVTREWTQSGLLGEKVRGDFTWKDGTKVTTMADNPVAGGKFNPVTGRFDGGVRLGNYKSTTFVGTGNYTGKTGGQNDVGGTSKTGPQVAVASIEGGNDGLGRNVKKVDLTAAQSTTLDSVLDGSVDITTLDVDTLTEVITEITNITEIDDLISTTTDPEILKSLYKRRLKLMRLNGSRTRFAGLLDDADTKKSQMSIV